MKLNEVVKKRKPSPSTAKMLPSWIQFWIDLAEDGSSSLPEIDWFLEQRIKNGMNPVIHSLYEKYAKPSNSVVENIAALAASKEVFNMPGNELVDFHDLKDMLDAIEVPSKGHVIFHSDFEFDFKTAPPFKLDKVHDLVFEGNKEGSGKVADATWLPTVCEVLYINTSFNDFSGIADIVKEAEEVHAVTRNRADLEGGVLGFLKIKGLKYVTFGTLGKGKKNLRIAKILNKYLEQPMGNKRIMDCQSELLDAGYEEHATF